MITINQKKDFYPAFYGFALLMAITTGAVFGFANDSHTPWPVAIELLLMPLGMLFFTSDLIKNKPATQHIYGLLANGSVVLLTAGLNGW